MTFYRLSDLKGTIKQKTKTIKTKKKVKFGIGRRL